jgi:DNA-directed RNA polymerase specialized sigma24 family protein
MTGQTIYLQLVKDFDNFFTEAYNKLRNEAVSITGHYDYSDDIVNDTYLKVRKRIWASGYTGSNFHGYCWLSIMNEWKVMKNREKIRPYIDIYNHIDVTVDGVDKEYDYINREVEKKLLEIEEENQQKQQYYDSIHVMVMVLFKYIEGKYSDKECSLFKLYFINSYTYKTLSSMTEYSLGYISGCIKPMKKDIAINFPSYFRKNIRRFLPN